MARIADQSFVRVARHPPEEEVSGRSRLPGRNTFNLVPNGQAGRLNAPAAFALEDLVADFQPFPRESAIALVFAGD